jgi:hypothetical protein
MSVAAWIAGSRRIAVVALTLCSAGAIAAPAQWGISGTLAGNCKIEFECPGSKTCTEIRFSNKPNETSGDVKWRCNIAGQPVVLEFTSQNGGVLINPQDTKGLGYLVSYSGGGSPGFTGQPLNAPAHATANGGVAFVEMTGRLTIDVRPRPEKLIAGRYNDQISVTITPNGM